MKNDLIVIGDNKKMCLQLKNNYLKLGINVVEYVVVNHQKRFVEEKLLNLYFLGKAEILLLIENKFLQTFTKQLHYLDVFNLYVYPYDIQLNCANRIPEPQDLIFINNQKPRLNFIDVEISERCNLHCKGCIAFSSLVREENFLDLNVFKNNILRLKELFWGVATIHLQGGEPLKNSEFLEYAKIVHEIFPDCSMQLLTNGLLITSIDIEKLKELKDYNCSLNISQYPVTRKMAKKIKQYLDKASAVYIFSLPKYIFAKKILIKPQKHPEISYKNCAIKRCTGMRGNYISPCMFPLHIYKLNEEFGLELPEIDNLDIYSIDVDGWELIEKLENKPIAFCSYCYYGLVPFLWKQRKCSEIELEDWIVKPKHIGNRFLQLYYRSVGTFFYKMYNLMLKIEEYFHKR